MTLFALSKKGDILWNYPTEQDSYWAYVHAPPTIDNDGNLYVALNATYDKVVSLTPDGQLRWEFAKGVELKPPPTISEDGTLYINQETIYAVDQSGQDKWAMSPASSNMSDCPVVIGSDATMYILYSNAVYSLEGSSPLMNSSWPMFRHDPQNSGNANFPINGSKNKR